MDLSARVLLKDRDITLLTHPKNAPLYSSDPIFSSVYSNSVDLRKEEDAHGFDLVICDSFSPRVLIRKLMLAPFTPFVGLYGYINGFEVHRTQFAFERMRELLGLKGSLDIAIRPTIGFHRRQELVEFDICIAVGGEWSFRTYRHWLSVVEALLGKGLSVLLVGSHNGVGCSDVICEQFSGVRSSVGKVSLSAIAKEIGRARIFIGADGGLWHVACALPIPSVVLFADCEMFDHTGARVTRETKDMICEALYDEVEVSNISVDLVVHAFENLCDRINLSSV